LTLKSGRTITLDAIDQEMTYSGLIEGIPYAALNNDEIDRAMHKARSFGYAEARPYLIPAPRRDYLRKPGDASGLRSWPGPLELLPAVRCIASFKHVIPVRDRDKHRSVLTVVWFQDDFALPIEQTVLDQLRLIDWDSLAVDVEL
jgi:hypothetical protein